MSTAAQHQIDDEMLTRKEAAAVLKISLTTLDELVASGRIPVIELGPRTKRFRRSDLLTLR